VIDFAWPLSIRHRHRCALTSALIRVSSRFGFRAGAATPSGIMIAAAQAHHVTDGETFGTTAMFDSYRWILAGW
jgi:hypothetical protein